ncbi:DgyrCDS13101 [Dimorphilus gyrociliatus]|uniref:DgyrCDS13101 n=1 Tax=Dimorphilus gyrociliatus TaxID=2664684 RepID=A0A7I8W9R1_9ANNE|nr:DgyrCDS13101 [Dimorphilus gyrociliatus]
MDENSIRQAEIGAVKQLLNLPSDATFDKTIRSLQKTISAARKIKNVKTKLGQLLNVADCEVEQMISMFEEIVKENQELKQQDTRQKNLIGQLKEDFSPVSRPLTFPVLRPSALPKISLSESARLPPIKEENKLETALSINKKLFQEMSKSRLFKKFRVTPEGGKLIFDDYNVKVFIPQNSVTRNCSIVLILSWNIKDAPNFGELVSPIFQIYLTTNETQLTKAIFSLPISPIGPLKLIHSKHQFASKPNWQIASEENFSWTVLKKDCIVNTSLLGSFALVDCSNEEHKPNEAHFNTKNRLSDIERIKEINIPVLPKNAIDEFLNELPTEAIQSGLSNKIRRSLTTAYANHAHSLLTKLNLEELDTFIKADKVTLLNILELISDSEHLEKIIFAVSEEDSSINACNV